MMEGYTVKEAASVLGVPSERVWELIARGVLAAEPEGKSGMRVFLQPRVPVPTQRGGRSGGNGDAERSNDPFRELLTEFRNLTERYGQALLALGEARGEVASLRSRVDLLEARIDLRLSSAEPTPPLAWTAPPQAAADSEVAPAAALEDTPTAAREAAPTPAPEDAEPVFEAGPTEAVSEPTEAVSEPTEAVSEPAEMAIEPSEAISEPAESVTAPAETVTEPTEAISEPAESVTAPAETVTEPTEAIIGEAPAEHEPAAAPTSAEEHGAVTPSGEAPTTRRRRRALSNREAVAWFAEALARADDPSRPELPGSREVAEALAALRDATVTGGEASVEEEILVGASASAVEVPIAEELEPQMEAPTADVATPVEARPASEPSPESAEPGVAPELEVEATGPAPEPEVEATGAAPEPQVEDARSTLPPGVEELRPLREPEVEEVPVADELAQDVSVAGAAVATETAATGERAATEETAAAEETASSIAPSLAPPVIDEAPTTYGEPEDWSRPGPSYRTEVEGPTELAREPEPEPPTESPPGTTIATAAGDEPDLGAYSTQFGEPDWISDDDLEGVDSTAARDVSGIDEADDAERTWTLDREPVIEAAVEPAEVDTPPAPIDDALEHDDLGQPEARHADHFLQGTSLEPFDLDTSGPVPSVEPEGSAAAAQPPASSDLADESWPDLALESSEMYEAELEFATPGWHVPGQELTPPTPHEGADEALPGEDPAWTEPADETTAATAWDADEDQPDEGEPGEPEPDAGQPEADQASMEGSGRNDRAIPPHLAPPSERQLPDRSLPGADALDDAMAALDRPPVSPQPDDRETFSAPPTPIPDRGVSVPPAFNWRPSPEQQVGTDPDWLGDRPSPAARAYRRLRRIFPG